jgi:hypothetical protein
VYFTQWRNLSWQWYQTDNNSRPKDLGDRHLHLMDEMNDGQMATTLGPRVPLQETERVSEAEADVLAPPECPRIHFNYGRLMQLPLR